MIGGMARVVQDIPPFMIVAGDPAFVSGLNSVGLSRAGMPAEERSELKKAFRILFIAVVCLCRKLLLLWNLNWKVMNL